MNAVQAFDCDHCRDTRAIDSPTMGVIRCPRCTRRTPKNDPSGLDQVSRDDAELREQVADRIAPMRYTGLAWTVSQLYRWGHWVRDNGIGYPSESSTEKANRGGVGKPEDLNASLPPDIELIDRAVAQSPVDYKTVLIEHYTKVGFTTDKAGRLGISRDTYYRRKASAERHIANTIGV